MSGPTLASIAVGDALPERVHTPDERELFLYNAALWNAHRIHFDLPYATEVEGYPGLVMAGPMMGDWMVQVVDRWLGDAGEVVGVAYSNRQAAYIGESLTAGGTVSAIDADAREVTVDGFVKNAAGDVLTPGSVTVRLGA